MNVSVSLPDVTGLDVFDAALEYAANGIAVAPFDPSRGKGKAAGTSSATETSPLTPRSCCGGGNSSDPSRLLPPVPASSAVS